MNLDGDQSGTRVPGISKPAVVGQSSLDPNGHAAMRTISANLADTFSHAI